MICPSELVSYIAEDEKLCEILLDRPFHDELCSDRLFIALVNDLTPFVDSSFGESYFEDINDVTETIALCCYSSIIERLAQSKYRYCLLEVCQDLYRLYPRNYDVCWKFFVDLVNGQQR